MDTFTDELIRAFPKTESELKAILVKYGYVSRTGFSALEKFIDDKIKDATKIVFKELKSEFAKDVAL